MSVKPAIDLRQLKATAQGKDPTKDEKPLVTREHIFTLKYTDPDGTFHEEQVLSKILDGDERIDVARIAAKRAGVEWGYLPIAQAARIWAQATIAIQLREMPSWLGKWATEDDSLLFCCYEVCQAHETEFFRRSDGEGTPGAKAPRVFVSSTLAAIATREPA